MKRSSNSRVWKPARTRIAISDELLALALQRLDLVADPARFLLAVPDAAQDDALALVGTVQSVLPSRPSFCAISAEAAAEDVRRRAVVLLEADDLRAGEVASRSAGCCRSRRRARNRSTGRRRRRSRDCDAPAPAAAARDTARRWCPGTRRPGCSGSAADSRRGCRRGRRRCVRLCSSRSPKSAALSVAQPLLIERGRASSARPSASSRALGRPAPCPACRPRSFQRSMRAEQRARRPALLVDALGRQRSASPGAAGRRRRGW